MHNTESSWGEKIVEPWGGFTPCNQTTDCWLPNLADQSSSAYVCWPMKDPESNHVGGYCRCLGVGMVGAKCNDLSPSTIGFLVMLCVVYVPVSIRCLYLVCRALVIHYEHRFNERMDLRRLNVLLCIFLLQFLLLLCYCVVSLISISDNSQGIGAIQTALTGILVMTQYVPISGIIVTGYAVLKATMDFQFGIFSYNDRLRQFSSVVMVACVIGYAVVRLIGLSIMLSTLFLIIVQFVASLTIGVLFTTTYIKLKHFIKVGLPDEYSSSQEGRTSVSNEQDEPFNSIQPSYASRARRKATGRMLKLALKIEKMSLVFVAFAIVNIASTVIVTLAVYSLVVEATIEDNMFLTHWILGWSNVQLCLILALQVLSLRLLLGSGKLTRNMSFISLRGHGTTSAKSSMKNESGDMRRAPQDPECVEHIELS